MTATMLRIDADQDSAEILEPTGWRPLTALEWIELPGGNYLQINSESYASGLAHGIAGGVLIALVVLGGIAWWVFGHGGGTW